MDCGNFAAANETADDAARLGFSRVLLLKYEAMAGSLYWSSLVEYFEGISREGAQGAGYYARALYECRRFRECHDFVTSSFFAHRLVRWELLLDLQAGEFAGLRRRLTEEEVRPRILMALRRQMDLICGKPDAVLGRLKDGDGGMTHREFLGLLHDSLYVCRWTWPPKFDLTSYPWSELRAAIASCWSYHEMRRDELLAIDPEIILPLEMAYYYAGKRCLAEGLFAHGLAIVRQGLLVFPGSVDLKFVEGYLLLNLGDVSEAGPLILDCLARRPFYEHMFSTLEDLGLLDAEQREALRQKAQDAALLREDLEQ